MKKSKLSFLVSSVFCLMLSGAAVASQDEPGGPGDDDAPPPAECPGGVIILGVCITHLK